MALACVVVAIGLVSAPLKRVPRVASRALPPRLELGFQIDPAATTGSFFALGSFAALQLKIRYAERFREERDGAVEALRQAEILLLAGKLESDDVERARAQARQAVGAYEDARSIAVLAGAQLRIPDPTARQAQRVLERQGGGDSQSATPPPPPPPPPATATLQAPTAARRDDGLDGLRSALGLKRPDASDAPSESLLPTGSRRATLKDGAIFLALAAQILWFLLSLTDPMGAPNPILGAALNAGGEMVDGMEAKRAARDAEYAAMLREAVEAGEAPPVCATRKLGDPLGGCEDAAELARTRDLDANRAWISGAPPAADDSLGP